MNGPQSLFESVWHEKLQSWNASQYVVGANLRVDAATSLLEAGSRLLDVGCGPGNLALAVKGKFTDIYGIDIAAQAVAVARKNGVIAEQVDISTEALPFEDAFFDAVALLAVLPYVYDPCHVLTECYRVLRPDGT